MIIETKVYSCRKCQSEDLVENGTKCVRIYEVCLIFENRYNTELLPIVG